MYRTNLVFAILVATIASTSSDETSSSGLPTDAWRTVTQNETFHLMYRSFEYDTGLGGTGKCVTITLCERNDTTRTTKSRIVYRDAKTTQLIGNTVRITLARSWNSTVDNIIQIGDADRCDAPAQAVTTQFLLAYSDFKTCDVLVVFGTREPKCELWIKDGYQHYLDVNTNTVASAGDKNIKTSIRKCKEEYKKLCQVKYPIYDKAICSSPPKGSKEMKN
uniref:Putative salivary lipocalin n=1 Tax=Ixodes ricinus TaxID=34613 RepID=A0A0K8R825_IXORI